MSVLINLPAFHLGISFAKETNEDDPMRYVTIRNAHAIVVSGYGMIVVNLKDYFINHDDIADADVVDFDALMDWLEGKSFTKEMWKEMTGLAKISVLDSNRILLEHSTFRYELVYEEQPVLIEASLKHLKTNMLTDAKTYPMVGIPQAALDFVKKTVGKIVGQKTMIMEFVEIEKPIRFTFKNMPCVFGMVYNKTFDIDGSAFNFEDFHEFTKNLDV